MRIEVRYSVTGSASWWLCADDGAALAWAGETFASMRDAAEAARTFKLGARLARYEVVEDGTAKWRWRTWRSGNKVESLDDRITDRAAAEQATADVRATASEASTP